MTQKFKWNYGRLSAFAIALCNIILFAAINIYTVMDPMFLKSQLGIDMSINRGIITFVALLFLVVCIYVNIHFIRRNQKGRQLVVVIEMMIMLFFMRSIYIGVLFSGFIVMSYIGSLIGLVIGSVLLYNTLFSNNIIEYFNEVLE